ncbi:Increased DNA methylation 1 [Glycine max]|nr:Increased DNA methylation 1 [Glycine max]
MESGVRSGGSGVVVKSRNSSGCLIVRKKGDGLSATASTSRNLYESKKRPNINVSVSSSDSGSSDELLMPPGRRLGPETIRVCNGLAASERGGSEISRKRDRVERISGSGEDIAAEKGLEQWERKRSKLDVYDFNEYDGMDVENIRRRHLDGHGGGRFMGSMHAARSGIDRDFRTGSSGRVLDKRKNSYGDKPNCLYPGDNVGHSRFKMNKDGAQVPPLSQREKFNSDESIRVQGKNGVLKVMVNKKKVGGPSEQYYDHHKPLESRLRLKTEEMAKRLKTEEAAKRLKTEGTSKRNIPIRPSSYIDKKPVDKPALHKRPEKKRIASRKSLSSKDSKGDEGDSDNSDTSLNPRIRNTEARKSVKKIISEDEQTPVHQKTPTTRTKEGKLKRGSGTEKQKLREQIREMLLNSGWTIDYRPRRNRDYLDAVYINPAGTAYWSIIKAYDALQKQLNDDADEVKPKGDSSSFAPIADEVLSQLTRKTRKKMEKELQKKKKRHDSESDSEKEPQRKRSASNKHNMNSMDSDSYEEKLSSFIKQGNKSMKNKMFENTSISARSKIQNATHHSSDGIEKSLFGCDPHIHGRKSKKHGRCTLLVRSSNKGSNSESDGFVPYTGKRTVLAWLIDSGTVELSQKVQYRRRKKVMLEGWITRDGIHCGCCSKILTVSKFELHAGSKLPQPHHNIYLESGVSLLQCQIDAWNRQEHAEKIGFHAVDIDGNDPNDDTCGICGDGGDLICCDGCPSTFHQSCLDIQMLPPGEWHCPNCTCKFCGIASGTSDKDDASVNILQTCILCEKKYHNSCTKEMNTLPNKINSSSLSFCGKECKELSEHLKKYLGTKHELEAGFSWCLIHRLDEDSEAACRGLTQRVECNSKLAIALTVMDECFLPVIDRRSGINLIRNVLYNSGSNFSRLSYSGFYTAILERGDEIIAAASIRFHGTKIAEMPFIGTRHIYRRQGMCRRLFSAIELVNLEAMALCSLKVEKLVIPAIAELTHTWTTVFGFTYLDESLRQEMKSLNMMVFPGIDMLQKLLVEQGNREGSEKMENGNNDFIKTKMGNRSDMGFSTPQGPRGSDDVSSNPANETNDECSDASQELYNQVLVDGIICSQSHSEEMMSDPISDKCDSPSRTSHSELEMKNKVAAAPPVDRLDSSTKCQSIYPIDSHPVDILKVQALVQETACSDPCPAEENLDKKCHSSTAMNCDSSELDINPVLDSEMADNTLPTKEVCMNDVLEVVPSGNISEDNITKGNNRNVDESSSALNHADESLFQVGSDSNGEIGCENEKDLLLNPGVASNETDFDESGVNASGDSSETVIV